MTTHARFALTGGIAAWLALGWVQDPRAPETRAGGAAAPAGRAEIRLRLLDPDGKAIAGAPVEFRLNPPTSAELATGVRPKPAPEATIPTNADGAVSFGFERSASPSILIEARAAGFATATWRWISESSDPLAKVIDLGPLTLTGAGSVRGRVVDDRRRPLPIPWQIYANTRYVPPGRGGENTYDGIPTKADSAEFATPPCIAPGTVFLKAFSQLTGWIDGPSVDVHAGAEAVVEIVYNGPDPRRRIFVWSVVEPYEGVHPEPMRVWLHDASNFRRRPTIDKGDRWYFDDLPPGTYTVVISDPKFLNLRSDPVSPGNTVEARLVGASTICLRVIDGATHAPLADYRLQQHFHGEGVQPRDVSLRERSMAQPPDGRYVGIVAAPQTLVVDVPGYARSEVRVENLEKGETRDVTVEMFRGSRVLGVARMSGDGAPAPHLPVSLRPWFTGNEGAALFGEGRAEDPKYMAARTLTTRTDAEGRFEFNGVPKGVFIVRTAASPTFEVRVTVTVNGLAEPPRLELTVPHEYSFVGKLATPSGARADGLMVCAFPVNPAWLGESVRVHPAPWSIGFRSAVAASPIDASGTFRLHGLPDGGYEIWLDTRESPEFGRTDPWIWQSERARKLGTVTIPTNPATIPQFDLVEQFPGRALVTVEVDGKPAAHDRIVLLRKSLTRTHEIEFQIPSDGTANVGPLFPGSWPAVVRSMDPLWEFVVADPIQIHSGAETKVSIHVELAEGTVQLVDANSQRPLTQLSIAIEPMPVVYGAPRKTDSDGRLTLRLPAQTYTIRSADGPDTWEVTLDWTAKGPVPATIPVSRSPKSKR